MSAAWFTALATVGIAVAGLLGWGIRWAWRLARGTARFLDDYFGEPEHNGLTARPGVMARLASVEQLLAHVIAETTPNGGTSMRDEIARTARDVAAIKDEQTEMRARIELFESKRREERR